MAKCCPFFSPALLPPRQGRAQRPTSPSLAPVHLDQPEHHRLLSIITATTISPPPSGERHRRSPSGQVAVPITFLSSPSCSRMPPLPPHRHRPSPVSPADHRLARRHPVLPLVPVGHTWSPTHCHSIVSKCTTAPVHARPWHGDRAMSHQHVRCFPS
jgi:hypothetical protein